MGSTDWRCSVKITFESKKPSQTPFKQTDQNAQPFKQGVEMDKKPLVDTTANVPKK